MTIPVIETIQRNTPLGVEFWDLVTDAPVTDGLTVSARLSAHHGSFRQANATPSGAHAVTNLPGLRAVEVLRPEPGDRAEPPDTDTVDVDLLVEDRSGRFLTMVMRVEAPQRGLVNASHALAGCASVDWNLPDDFPMFLLSAPTRFVPRSMASVRACLRHADTYAPAAHAVVSIEVGGRRHLGAADGDGNLLIAFPFPTFANGLTTPPGDGDPDDTDPSPAGTHGIPTDDQHWDATVEIRWQPSAFEFPAGVDIPRAHSLFCQDRAEIIGDADLIDPVDTLTGVLRYGQELVLVTANPPDPAVSSCLLVVPAT